MKIISNFRLPIVMLVLTAGVLLLSDLKNRNSNSETTQVEYKSGQNDLKVVALVNLIDSPALDPAIEGLVSQLEASGFIEGENYQMQRYNAQGDLSLLPQIIDSAIQKQPDVIVSITSPALVAASAKIKTIPYVFCVATDPSLLGLFSDGTPKNITGIYATSTIPQLIELALRYAPMLDSIATIYDPSQSQSVIEVEILKKECKQRGILFHSNTVSSVSDIPLAAQSLIQRGSDVFITSADNLVNVGFPSLEKQTQKAGIPLLVSDLALMEQGATAGIGPDFVSWGKQAADQVVKILNGENPSEIPMEAVKVIEMTK